MKSSSTPGRPGLRASSGMVAAAATPASEVEIPDLSVKPQTVEQVGRAPPAAEQAHAGQRDQRAGQLQDAEVVGEEQADQAHRGEVVDYGQGQQEDPQVRRQLRPRDGQGGDGEGDVGGDRHGPPMRGRALKKRRMPHVDGEVDQRRTRHAAERGDHRQGEPARIGQFAADDLVLDLQADDEEEDRHQAFLHPVDDRQRLGKGAQLDGEGLADEAEIDMRPGRVGECDGGQRRDRQDQARSAFGLQEIERDPLGHAFG
jgi:hypothetical protein